jgi:hypothetical protein
LFYRSHFGSSIVFPAEHPPPSMALLVPALKMAKFLPHVEGRGVQGFVDEPDPFIEGVQVVPCPKAEPQARQRGPVIQLNAEGAPMSTGTIWPGAPYADGAKPTTAENPLRPASAPPVSRGKCTRPIPDGLGPNPDGPAVALSPRFDAGTAPVAGKPRTGRPAEQRSSGDPLGPSPLRRARSAGLPPVPGTPAANDLDARERTHTWLQAQQTPPVNRARPPQNEQASSSGSGLRVP